MAIRCAVAGLNRGSLFVRLLTENPDCQVVAVCDPRPEKLAEFGGLEGFESFEAMLGRARPDVVAIITPGPLHAPQTLLALEAGAHVLVETPNVYSLQEAEAVVGLARRKGLKYMLAEDYVYMGWCRAIAGIVESGKLGTILGARGEYTHDCRGGGLVDSNGKPVPFSRAGEPGVRALWRFSHLPPLAYSSHTLGPLLDLIGDRCDRVTGVCGGKQTIGGIDVFPLETAVFTTVGGAVVNLTNGFMLGHPLGFSYAVYGSEGAIRVEHTGTPKAFVATDADGGGWREMPLPWAEREDGLPHVKVMVDAYIESVKNDTPPPFDEARSMDFCLPGVLAHESAKRGGEPMAIPLF